jgi:hypothetical protein
VLYSGSSEAGAVVTGPGLAHLEIGAPMQTRSYPKQLTTPAPAMPVQEPASHLLGGICVASCPSCGYQLTTARTQERCEQRAGLRRCPVCREDA